MMTQEVGVQTARRKRYRRTIVKWSMSAALCCTSAWASSIVDVFDASRLLNGTIPDGGAVFLTESADSFLAGQTLTYTSSADASGWSAGLLGSYGGTAVDVTYSGSFSAFSQGLISWSSSGFFGANAWVGVGIANFTNDGLGTLVNYLETVSIGDDTFVLDLEIEASVDQIDFVDDQSTSGAEAQASGGTGGNVVSGKGKGKVTPKPKPKPKPSPKPAKPVNTATRIETHKKTTEVSGTIAGDDKAVIPELPAYIGSKITGTVSTKTEDTVTIISTSPEPGTSFLMGGALLAFAEIVRRRRAASPK